MKRSEFFLFLGTTVVTLGAMNLIFGTNPGGWQRVAYCAIAYAVADAVTRIADGIRRAIDGTRR